MTEETRTYSSDERFHEAIAAFEEARDAGSNPTVTEWLKRYPDVADRLREYFADARNLRGLASPIAVPATLLPDIPDYDIIEPVAAGTGGMGMVFKARKQSTQQIVALKVIRPDLLENLTPDQRRKTVERFITEARVAALLEHENIVKVYDVGEIEGRPYYAMRYVEGKSLSGLIQDGTVPSGRAAAYIEQIARAVHLAHQHGIIHRDLKPNNILVESKSDKPLVADFGLAKLLVRDQEMTRTGDIMGAPPYMSPEQALNSAGVTTATDVYGLGATLYALLTGRPPFQGDTAVATLKKVVEEEPLSPRKINSAVPRDLETICLKCLEKDPKKRYESADQLAGRLRLFLENRPIPDRPVSRTEKLWRWCRRNPVVAGLLATVVLVVVTGIAAVLQQLDRAVTAEAAERNRADELGEANAKLQEEQKETKRQRKLASDRADENEDNLANTTMQLARARFEENSVSLAEELLEQLKPKYRQSPWKLLKNYVAGSPVTLRGHQHNVTSVMFSPDGQTLASGSDDQTVKLWDARTGQELRTLRGHQNDVRSVTFSPDGQTLASGSYDVKLWDARTGQELRTLRASGGTSVAFSPDGQTLASGSSSDKTVKLWDARTGQELRTLRGHQNDVRSVTFSPDGQTLASGSGDYTVKLWDVRTGQELRTLRSSRRPTSFVEPVQGISHQDYVNSVTFSPDGQTLASGSSDQTVKLWDVRTGQELRTLREHQDAVISVTFSPDGKTLASGSSDKTVKLWDARTGQELRTLRGHQKYVLSVTFSPDGQTLASGSGDQTVKLWDVRTGQEHRTLRGHQGDVFTVTLNPDGQTLASASWDRTVKLWDVRTGQEHRTLGGHQGIVWSVTFSPDGQTLASGSQDTTVKLWDARTGQELRTLRGHQSEVRSVTFSPDGQTLASGSNDHTVKLWDARTGQELRTLRGQHIVWSVTFSPDGQTLASGSEDNTVKLWDARTGQELRTLRGHQHVVTSVTFSPDGQTLASGSGQRVKLWDARTGQELRTLRGHQGGVNSVTFSPDGQTLASATWDKTVKLWDARTGQELRTLRGHQGGVNSVTFSPDGQTLASGSNDHTVKLWDARTVQGLRILRGHQSVVNSVTFSPDGKTLASGSDDKTVKLWDARTGQELRTLRGHQGGVISVTFSLDGQMLASGSQDKTVKLWDARTGRELRALRHGRQYGVYSVAFSPDGQTLASGSDGVKLWDARTGQELRTLHRHQGGVISVTFSPDGQSVFGSDSIGWVVGWDVRTGDEVDLSKAKFGSEGAGVWCPDGTFGREGAGVWCPDGTLFAVAGSGGGIYLVPKDIGPAEKKFRQRWTMPDPGEHLYQAQEADKNKQTFAAACRVGAYLNARSAFENGRDGKTAFIDGLTFAGILLKNGGQSPKKLVLRTKLAALQFPKRWQNREAYGAALFRDGDAEAAVRELTESIKARGDAKPGIFCCHFLALAHHKLGHKDEAKGWLAKAVLAKDAPWREMFIDRALRQEVASVLAGKDPPTTR
jgi:WD40 repeat protein